MHKVVDKAKNKTQIELVTPRGDHVDGLMGLCAKKTKHESGLGHSSVHVYRKTWKVLTSESGEPESLDISPEAPGSQGSISKTNYHLHHPPHVHIILPSFNPLFQVSSLFHIVPSEIWRLHRPPSF
jgi:hypothetical protein